jgi:hypothetical protein
MTGTGDQIFTLGGITSTGTLTVTKPSGTAYLTGTATLHNISLTQGTLTFWGGSTYTIDDADAINTSAGTTFNFDGSPGNLVTLRSDAAAQWDLNVSVDGNYSSDYVDVAYSNAAGGQQINTYHSTNSLNNTNWVFASGVAHTISGICKKYDQSTNCADGETIKVAVNNILDANTGSTSGGAWSILNVTISPGDVITVFVDGVADDLEANDVTRYDSIGDMTGIILYEEHLTLGSDDNADLSNSRLTPIMI